MRRLARGFTLIEMVVVLAIVGILAAAAVPMVELSARRAQELTLRAGLRAIRQAIDAHKAAVEARQIAPSPTGTPYPATLDLLVQGAPVLDAQGRPREDGRRLYLLRRLPRDPFAEASTSAAESWGQRSSASPPEAPAAGDDVFDVYSRARGVALDGSRYGDW